MIGGTSVSFSISANSNTLSCSAFFGVGIGGRKVDRMNTRAIVSHMTTRHGESAVRIAVFTHTYGILHPAAESETMRSIIGAMAQPAGMSDGDFDTVVARRRQLLR